MSKLYLKLSALVALSTGLVAQAAHVDDKPVVTKQRKVPAGLKYKRLTDRYLTTAALEDLQLLYDTFNEDSTTGKMPPIIREALLLNLSKGRYNLDDVNAMAPNDTYSALRDLFNTELEAATVRASVRKTSPSGAAYNSTSDSSDHERGGGGSGSSDGR